VLVTLLGLALSAWLLPAMTRQWDDRQREHELKAALVAEMASATARALVDGEAIWSGRDSSPQQRAQIGDEWVRSALSIEARLRSYFSSSVVADWQVFAWAVDRFIEGRHVSLAYSIQDITDRDVKLDAGPSGAAAELLFDGENTIGPAPNFTGDAPTDRRSMKEHVGRLKRMLRPHVDKDQEQIARWSRLEKDLLGLEQTVADQIIASDAAGFSTTSRELLHDLLGT